MLTAMVAQIQPLRPRVAAAVPLVQGNLTLLACAVGHRSVAGIHGAANGAAPTSPLGLLPPPVQHLHFRQQRQQQQADPRVSAHVALDMSAAPIQADCGLIGLSPDEPNRREPSLREHVISGAAYEEQSTLREVPFLEQDMEQVARDKCLRSVTA